MGDEVGPVGVTRAEAAAARARLFVAVWPPDDVLDAIEALPRPEAPGVRWTSRAQWHVTLRFLGDADLDVASTALATVEHPPVEVTLGPQASRLGRSVVCLPAAGLDALAAAVAAATAGIGKPPDPRPFAGHLTLARLRHRAACGVAGAPFHASFTATELTLVRSHLEPTAARYEIVTRAPLTR